MDHMRSELFCPYHIARVAYATTVIHSFQTRKGQIETLLLYVSLLNSSHFFMFHFFSVFVVALPGSYANCVCFERYTQILYSSCCHHDASMLFPSRFHIQFSAFFSFCSCVNKENGSSIYNFFFIHLSKLAITFSFNVTSR